mgnify:FL=1
MNTPDHTSRDHAEFSPSSLKYVAGCAGYQGRDGTSEAAEKGTRIHEALEVRDPSALHNEEETGIYDAIVAEETAFLEAFVKGADHEELNEVLLDVALDGVNTWGTCDRLIIVGDKAVLADYKTGISKIDPPRDNWQARAYTVGAFQAYPDIQEITFVFYVPVRNETLTGVFKREELPELIETLTKVIKDGERVRPKWEEGQPELDELNPTVDCRFCAHEDHCPALGGLAVEVASRVADSKIPKGDIADPDDLETLEHLWVVAKIVTNWATRIKSKAIAKAKAGAEFPTLRLRSMGASRKCTDNTKMVKIAEDFGLSVEELLELTNIPIKKVADAVGDTAAKGGKRKKSNNFLDALETSSIIESSETRYTLS